MTGHSAPKTPTPPGSLLVMGVGSVGAYVGGCLQSAGIHVDYVGRPHALAKLRTHGLRLSDQDGRTRQLAAADLRLHEQVPEDRPPALVLLCVKSSATAAAMQDLARRLPPHTPVLSLQNGVRNVSEARQAAPAFRVIPGMVPFNVAELAPGHFHRGSAGHLAAQDTMALQAWQRHFQRAGIPLTLHDDLQPVQWGKLLLNLNNPVNALSGLPLRAQLLEARHRRQYADLMQEALRVMRCGGIRPQRMTPLPWPVLVWVLRLPTPLFRRVAARILRIDPLARSSMADDVARGRTTEIDELCGEIVRMAHRTGIPAPVNAAMLQRLQALSTPTPPHLP